MSTPLSLIPTDNLYKFLAISGVVVFISSLYLLPLMNAELLSASNAITKEQVNIVHQKRLLEASGFDKASKEYRIGLEKVGNQIDLLAPELKRQDDVLFRGKIAIILSLIGAVMGFGMASTGFKWWYSRIQLFQDAILRKEAGTKEIIVD